MLGLATALIFAQAASAPAGPSPPRAPCADTAHAAFDFWLGEWDVYPNGSDKLVAHSKIEKLYGGCAVRENWMPLQGTGGGSLNSIDPATGRWHQEWVGSAPGRVDFDGGLVGREMVLTGYSPYAGGGAGKPGLVRIVYTPYADGSVRQHGLASLDQGLTWHDSYDFIYRPHKAAG
jgi:hypothetical protein